MPAVVSSTTIRLVCAGPIVEFFFSSLFLMYQEAADRIDGISPFRTPENPCNPRETNYMIRYNTTISPKAPNMLISIHTPPTKVTSC